MKHMQREIDKLKKKILGLSAVVEESVHRAVSAIERRDEKIAKKVIDSDFEIDHLEVDVEEDCLKILALHQPVAADLRFVIAVLKINNDLERIADLAVNISEQAAYLATQPKTPIPFDFPSMSEKAKLMLRQSMDALVNGDIQVARKVLIADDEVDAINRQMYDQVKNGIRRHPDQLDALIHLLSVSRHLERIADHATNIAEDVLYMIEGEIVRHRAEQYLQPPSESR